MPTTADVIARRQVSFVAIRDLVPDPDNPRKHDRAQIRAIARSIEAFGFNAPILIDQNRKIIAGHGRYEAADLLGCAQVPVIFLDHLSETQARAYRLADNKLTDRSTWDDEKVAVQLKELSTLALDFEIEAIGFELPEIDFRIQSLDDAGVADAADEFTLPKERPGSTSGDLWLLGSHRLLCGNALDAAAYGVLMEGAKADAVFTDPPYNVKIDGHVCGKGDISHREFAMAAGEMTEAEFADFLGRALNEICQRSEAGAIMYVFMDWRHMGEMLAAGRAAARPLINLCVWAKNNGGMGSLYRSRHELVFVFKNGNAPHLNNVQLGRFGRNRNNVWNYAGANGFPRKGKKVLLELHPTVKPIALVTDAILDFNQATRHRARSLSGKRHDGSSRRAKRSQMLRHRDRPALRRHCHRSLAAAHRAAGALSRRRNVRSCESQTRGTSMSSSPKNYEVGYGRPPMHSRWKKGTSGNSKRGARSKSVNAVALIERLFLARVEITINGQKKAVPTIAAIILQLWLKEIKGDRKALDVRLKFEALARENSEPQVKIVFVEDDPAGGPPNASLETLIPPKASSRDG